MGRWGSHAARNRSEPGNAPRESEPDVVALEQALTESDQHASRTDAPPVYLREASTDSPPCGYQAHKGCLFPSSNSHGAGARPSRWNRTKDIETGPTAPSQDIVDKLPDSLESFVDGARHAEHRNARRSRTRAERRHKVLPKEGKDSEMTALLWVRDDMRLDDNPALRAAAGFRSLICVFVHDVEDPSPWPLRGAAKWWKGESIKLFAATLHGIGSPLFLRVGNPEFVLLQICAEASVDVVMWNRQCAPWSHERDTQIEEALRLNEVEVRTFKAAVLWEPWEARPDERSYDRGFGSVGFYRSAVEELGEIEAPFRPVKKLQGPPQDAVERLESESIRWDELGYHFSAGRGFPPAFESYNMKRQSKASSSSGGLQQVDDWASEMKTFWRVGEQAAMARLREFLEDVLAHGLYEKRERFRADRKWTAILSPYIRFGELSARRCYHEALCYAAQKVQTEKGPRPLNNTFARRFFWRDLAYWALWCYPEMPGMSLRPHYETERWRGTATQLKAWQRGRTGFPLVDAGMRQLWRVGWMPNYLRHVCAQFLIEFLDISWKRGFEWFDYTLVDSDVAINAFMWQNGGHSGLDQWNFVMHPVFAAKSCDPEGNYVRQWVPELARLPPEYIHCPWEAPAGLLLSANCVFHCTYAARILEDLNRARRDHAREVLRVRGEHPDIIAKGGNEWFETKNGYWVTLITRDDFRQNTDEAITRQTADKPRDARKRQLQDPISLVMGDFVQQHEQLHANEHDVL